MLNSWLILLAILSLANGADPNPGAEGGGDMFAGFPLVIQLFLVVFLIGLSGIFCGLTIGVMGMNTLSLEIIASAGREPDRTYAQTLLPVRKLGHQALATLVLGNMGTNVMIAQLVADITPASKDGSSTVLSFVVATLIILIFAEVLPQSICKSSHALFIASEGIPVLKIFLWLMYPVAKPLGMLLDLITPHECGQLYSRSELKELMKVHCETHGERSGLDNTELQLLLGAMEFHEAVVSHIMTPFEEMIMVSSDAVIDRALVSHLWEQGLSRIPVYKDDRRRVVGVLFLKNLISLFDRLSFSTGGARNNTAVDSSNREGSASSMAVPAAGGFGSQITVEDALKWFEHTTVFVTSDFKVTKLLKVFEHSRTQIAMVFDGSDGAFASASDSGGASSPRASSSFAASGPFHPSHLTKSFGCELLLSGGGGNSSGGDDVQRDVIGLVTMEDVIEKLLRSDVRDEYDESTSDSGDDLESSGNDTDDTSTRETDPELEPNRTRDAPRPELPGPVAGTLKRGTAEVSGPVHRKLQLSKPPRRMPSVNFYGFAPNEAFSDAEKWVVAEYLRESVPYFSYWKVSHMKLLLDLVGDRRFVPPPPKPRSCGAIRDIELDDVASPITEAVSSAMHTHRRFFPPVVFCASGAQQVADSHRKYVNSLPPRYVLYRAGRPADHLTLVLCGGVDVIALDVAVSNELRSMTTIGEKALEGGCSSSALPPQAGGGGPFVPDYSAVVVRPSRIVVIRQKDVAKVEKYISGLRHHHHRTASEFATQNLHRQHSGLIPNGHAAGSGAMKREDARSYTDEAILVSHAV